MKKHFILATIREAKLILREAKFVKKLGADSKIYQFDSKTFIFICGMGGEKSSKNFTNYIKCDFISLKKDIFYNLGICGACKLGLSLHQSYRVKTVQNEEKDTLLIHSSNGLNLLSSKKPIWDIKKREKLAKLGVDIVDMEAFFLVKVMRGYFKNFVVKKVISDFCYKESEEEFQKSLRICQELLKKEFELCINYKKNG